jgi:hypothetical protein
MKKQRNGKLIFNLVVTLLLVLAVTGFGKPGFLLRFLQAKEPKTSASAQVRPSPLPARGHSDPFDLEPMPGFRISAEKDAMDRNRSFTVRELAWEKLEELTDRLCEEGTYLLFFAGWEVDAGMSDEEQIPGTYQVRIDLSRLGIPEKLYDLLRAYRLDDGGRLTEYVSWVKDGFLFYESNQNSGTVLGADLFVTVLQKFIELSSPAPETGFFEKDGTYWVRNPEDPAIKQYKIIYDKAVVKNTVSESDKAIIEGTQKNARAKVNRETFEGTDEEKKEKKNERYLELLQEMCRNDPIVSAAFESEHQARKEAAERAKDLVATIGAMCYEAHRYLASLDIRLPVAATEIYLLPTLASGSAAETEPSMAGPYVNVNLEELQRDPAGHVGKYLLDEMQLTLTHELFHVCQMRYCYATHANVKFYEAMAELVEEESQEYYKTHYKVTLDDYIITTNHNANNGYKYEYYAMPFNDTKVTYYRDNGAADSWKLKYKDGEGITQNKRSESGYPVARFMEYLNKYVAKKTFKEMLETMESSTGNLSFGGLDLSEHLRTTWGFTEEELTKHYLAFAKKYQTKFYAYQQGHVGLRPFSNLSVLTGDHVKHYKLADHAYSLRVTEILSGSLDIVARVGHLLVPDEDFADQLPDMTLMPIGAAQWTKCKYGIFFYPHLEGAIFIMEVDGGTNPNTSGASGYMVYQLDPPQLEEVEVADGLLSFKLPDKSRAARDGKIDGYRVTITCSDGKKTVYYPKIVIAGQTVKLKTSRLNKGDHKDDEDPLSYTVTVCEYIKDKNRYLFGPESNPDDMDSLLEEMGAVEGEITASIYWPSKDDLDLHCVTPDGGHIYYSNKSAGGGELDVDMQVQGDRDSGVENIYFAAPTPGEYQFYINNYTDRTEGDTGCRIRIKVGNQILVDETVSMGGRSKTYKLTYGGQGQEQNVEVLEGN